MNRALGGLLKQMGNVYAVSQRKIVNLQKTVAENGIREGDTVQVRDRLKGGSK